MRLINTATMAIEEFTAPKIPAYCILSHTWGNEEITLREYEEGRSHNKSGHQKVVDAVALARNLRHKYIWIDTCCIDKTSSADLTEAINSMYMWYRNADICLVYLEDLPPQEEATTAAETIAATALVLGRCRWFSRGWTLQELVAPRRLAFFDASWKFRGTKRDHVKALAQRTRIPQPLLVHKTQVRDYALARRMAWAAGRQTSRPEDTAYCLLGIFEVHMALAYGEGVKAFRRLQEEIVKHSSDLTIFAWNQPRPTETEEEVAAAADLAAAGNGDDDDGGLMSVPYRLPALPTLSPLEISLASLYSPTELSEETETSMASVPRAASASPVIRAGSHGGAHRRHRAQPENCLFAPSPAAFARFAGITAFLEEFENFAVTNRGLFVAGLVYLRTMKLRVPDEGATKATATAKTIYVLILGRQDALFIFLPLLKIGPNLFQRDWDTDMLELTHATVDGLRGVPVSDWYIQVDRRPLAEKLSLRYRQGALHMPAQNEKARWVAPVSGSGSSDNGATTAIQVCATLQTVAPTHLWDERDRIFLRPRPYGNVHYDAVLVSKHLVAVVGGDRYSWQRRQRLQQPRMAPTAVIVLCRFSSDQKQPTFYVYKEQTYPDETALLLMHRSPHSCVTWQELSVWCPQLGRLSDRIVLDAEAADRTNGEDGEDGEDDDDRTPVPRGQVQIRVSSVETKIDLGSDEADVHSLTLEVTQVQ